MLRSSNQLASASLLAGVITCALCSSAMGQANPTFKFGDAKEVENVAAVEWKASAQAGLIATTGNSQTTAISGGAQASRKTGQNKLLAEGNVAYARSTLIVINDLNGDMIIQDDEIVKTPQTTTRAWSLKARYDRFLSLHNSLYLTALTSADIPAGKRLASGAQTGYSRQLFKSDAHEFVGEVGYDFSYEVPTKVPDPDDPAMLIDSGYDDGVAIHSARLFVGYNGKLTAGTGVIGALELLSNLNTLNDVVDPFDDTRLNASLAVTTTLFKDISLRFGVTARYDHAPAINPKTTRPAEKLDTKTEAVVVVNLL